MSKDHAVVHLRLQLSLDPGEPLDCVGMKIEWRKPHEEHFTLLASESFPPQALAILLASLVGDLHELVGELPQVLPFE